MVREGTRSQTGNARPRVFDTVDTQPTIKRSKPIGAGRKKTVAPAPIAKGPGASAGVTKKKAPAKQAGGAVAKAKVTASKVLKKTTGAAKAAKK